MKQEILSVSAWKTLGKKYGYWDYFKSEAVKELPKVIEPPNELDGITKRQCFIAGQMNILMRIKKNKV